MLKRVFFVLLVLTFVGGFAGAAGSKAAESASAGRGPEPFTVTWFVNVPSWAWSGTWGEDITSKRLIEKFGIHINLTVAASDGGEQLSTMVASNSLPDFITLQGLWSATDNFLAYQLSQEGYMLSYNDMMNMSPDMARYARKDIIGWYAQPDGKTYFYPNYAYSSEDLSMVAGGHLQTNRTITIREDLWKAIGSPDMSSPQKFLDACQKVKDQIKTYNGAEIIGMQLYERGNEALSIINQYFATPRETRDGISTRGWDLPQQREALAFLNGAFRRGLITEANFSDTRELIREKVAQGRVFALIAAEQDFVSDMRALWDKDHNAVYRSVVLRNSAGDDPVIGDISGWGYLQTGVSARTRYPDRVAKFIGFLLSDEGLTMNLFGEEGVDFVWESANSPAGKRPVPTQAVKDTPATEHAKKYGFNRISLFDNYCWTMRFVTQDAPKRSDYGTDDDYAYAMSKYPDKIYEPMKQYSWSFQSAGGKTDPSDPRIPEMNELSIRLSQYTAPAVAEIITAPTEAAFNAKYDEVVKTVYSMGYEKLWAFSEEAFQKGKKDLGVKYIWPPFLQQ